MAQQIINVGTSANDGTGDTLRASQQKTNANTTELYLTKLEGIVAGDNVTIDNSNPLIPVISSTGGGGSSASTAKASRFELNANIDLGISPTGSVTVIDFDNQVFNTNSSVFVNNGSGTVTCTQAGSYLVTTCIVLESPLASAITKSELGIRKNGTSVICATTDDTPIAVGNNIRSLTTSTIINLSANDTLQTVVNLFGTTANGRGLRLPSLLGTTATQVSNISIEKLEVGGIESLGFTPVPETRTLTINGTTQDLSANRSFTVSSSQKRTVNYTYEFNGALNTATNNWWGAQVNGTPSLLVSSATLTPTNNFSGALVQSPAWVVPFNCRLKSIVFKGFSNTGSGTVDLAFSSGTYLGSGTTLVNNTILSNQPFVIHNYLGVSNFSSSLYVFDTGFTNYTIPKGYEIRMFMNNRNIGINLLSTTIMIEFEEVL